MPGSTTIFRGNIFAGKLISVTLAPAVVATATTAEQAFTVAGVQTGDLVMLQENFAQVAGVQVVGARVTGVNTVAVSFMNPTAGGVTPATGSYNVLWCRPETLPLDQNVL
mgnify:FL=1